MPGGQGERVNGSDVDDLRNNEKPRLDSAGPTVEERGRS